MIEHNLVDVLALLASIEARDETSALVDRIEARHETRCVEAMSTSLHSKKKEARKIEPPQINNECIPLSALGSILMCCILYCIHFLFYQSKDTQALSIREKMINNECIEKALIQLTGAVMEVGYLLKCILMVLVFFGRLVKILVMYFHVPKNQ